MSSHDQEPKRKNINIILVGDDGTGKVPYVAYSSPRSSSALTIRAAVMRRFAENTFDRDPVHRIQHSAFRHLDIDGKRINAQIFIRPFGKIYRGQVRCPAWRKHTHWHVLIVNSFYRQASGFCFTYDVSQRRTFSQVDRWVREVSHVLTEELPPSPIPVRLYLVGTKTDRKAEREVSTEEGAELAARCNIAFAETSALDGSGVEDLFMTVFTRSLSPLLSPAALTGC
ncbi:P-loop containing nucleoside triphosphate hydrolase [Mycena indigotica]|uniref:P-loop containing nucleoside triphosphate hydrolase n=1 Tax=Mycena indigotica TaxID=2126181 RepID=A0A8H6WBK2_9AGAR|nr:P-loop containing nucleoside triphosphate hydrolase [Mycena indigotica]KAF7310336.1 P-loop containing nucleoside triphosphate hydrolase [Mycena indigotica]